MVETHRTAPALPRTYWDFRPPGRLDYSCAEYLAGTGAVVVAVDNLNTGESSRPEPTVAVDIDLIAAANALALSELQQRLRNGTLVDGIQGGLELPTVGVGHSLGGNAVLAQQAAGTGFDAIAILGATVQTLPSLPAVARDGSLAPEELRQAIGRAVSARAWGVPWDEAGPYVTLNRANYVAHFYRDDVPADVIAADHADATVIPRTAALDVMVPGRWRAVAAAISCPVFLAYGNPDLSPDIDAEAPAFSSAPVVTVVRVPDSAHCHNLATGRRALWETMSTWLRRTVAPAIPT